jgi:aspartyl-tRNA(Asn)/glutamyl-tRNA(Gln) amidotransferase subunit A
MLQKREVSAYEVTVSCLKRIEQTRNLNALISVFAEGSLERARALDGAGPKPEQALWGVPLTLKDALSTKGMRTTCASRMLENFTPVYDAFAVSRLLDAGAIIVGKANLDEFGMGSSTEYSVFGPALNPNDTSRVPGGSSGGGGGQRGGIPVFWFAGR